jgi:hypothetical protein
VIETHVRADFVSGHLELTSRTGAVTCHGRERWPVGGASRQEVETAFTGWEMPAVELADTGAWAGR